MSEPLATAPAQEQAQTATTAEAETDWKAEARKWEQRAKDNKKALDDAAPKLGEYDRLVEASKTELERKTEELTRWQTDAQSWRGKAVSARIEVLASTDFADPSDAVGALDASKYLDAGGDINEAAIRADLAGVLDRKPHWRRGAAAGPRVPAPNHAQGSSVNGAGSSDPAAQFAAFLQSHITK